MFFVFPSRVILNLQRIPLLYWLILFFAFCLRFYNLGDVQQAVFDEVYFPKFAYGYIQEKPFFHTHPPFAKYLMMGGMKIYHALPWIHEPQLGSQAFEALNPVSYRWLNALVGSLLCSLIAGIMYLLTRSHRTALIAMGFVALDGTMIVASRYGLSNIHILFWGYLSLLFLVQALRCKLSWWYLVPLSVLLGLVVSVKWNGLSYWIICLVAISILLLLSSLTSLKTREGSHADFLIKSIRSSSKLKKFGLFPLLILVPAIIYSSLWVPDLRLNTRYDFREIHHQILTYHSSGVEADGHRYCSRWYSWPVMYKPISYHFEKIRKDGETGKAQIFKDIHLFGNPFLYWVSIPIMLALISWFFMDVYRLFRERFLADDIFIKGFIFMGYGASYLPWSLVTRCTFLYHYQTAAVFSFLSTAYILSKLWSLNKVAKVGVAIVFAALIFSFVYWLPFQLGIEISRSGFYQRMWFGSWI
ncbi:MAG: dolichyl-phosphate-mannose-protein mannosyltransferase [Flavobacteriales bacterium]